MARKTFDEYYAEYRSGKKSTEGAKASSGTTTFKAASNKPTKKKNFDDYYTEYKTKKIEKSIGLDTFESDLASVSDLVNSVYGGWQDADTMKSAREKVSAMNDRLNKYNTYVHNTAGDADLTQFDSGMNQLLGAYSQALNDWDSLSGTYGNYINADAYSKAKKQYELSDKYKGMDFTSVQDAITKNPDDAGFLSQYGVNVGYSNIADYNAELEALAEKIKKSPYAERQTLQGYYDKLEAAKNVYELDNQFDNYKGVMHNPDFAENAQYKNTAKKDGFWSLIGLDGSDETYEFINDVDGAREKLIAKYKDGNAATELEQHGYEYMTDDEKSVYNYIYNVEGKDAADKFLKDIAVSLSKRQYDETTAIHKQWADESPLLSAGMTAAAPILNLAGALGSGIETIKEKVTGTEYNPYSPLRTPGNVASDVTQYIGENIAEKTEGIEAFGINLPELLYSSGVSIANTALGTAILGKGYTAVAGMGAATQRARELKEQGASDEQIFAGATSAGVLEAVFERVGIGNLLKVKEADTIGKLVKETMKQMGIEASEEVFTEIANTVSDTIIRGDMSDVAQSIESYVKQGYSDKEAREKAALDVARNVLAAGLGGAISGGVMGGVATGSEYSGYKAVGNVVTKNNHTSTLADVASATKNDAYADYIKLLNEGKAGKAQVGSLYGKVAKDVETNYRNEVGNAEMHAIANRAIELGDSRDSGVIASAIQKKLSRERLSTEERNVLKTDTAKTIMQEIDRGEIHYGTNDSLRAAEDNRSKVASILTTPKSADAVRIEKRVASMHTGTETIDNQTGHKIQIEGMRVDDDGNTVLQTSEGARLIDEVTLTDNDAEVIAMAEGMDAEKGDMFVSLYQSGTDVEQYKTSFDLAFAYGENAFGSAEPLKNRGVLTEAQVASVYELGMRSKTATQQKVIDEITKKHFADNTDIVAGKFDDSAVDYKKLNGRQKAAISFSKMLSEKTGVNVVFFESKADENGRRMAENGRYEKATNTIYVDAYAGLNEGVVEDAIVPTLSHELTHWMKEKAPEAYSKLSSIVMETLANDMGVSPVDLIGAERSRYKQAHGAEVSEEYAQDELIARATEDMLTGSKQAKDIIAKMDEKTARTFAQKFKEVVEKLKEWMADLLNVYKSNSSEAKIIRKYADKLNELQEAWDDAFDKAIMANQAINKPQPEVELMAASERTQYAEREYYREEVGEWFSDGMPSGETFILGNTSDVIQGLGAMEMDIYILGDKIKTILEDHPEITIDEIKKIPQILENPILILASKNVDGKRSNSRIVAFGNVKGKNGQPVLSVLDLKPFEKGIRIDDMQKVSSAYTKTGINRVDFIRNSLVMYVDKKRATSLLRTIGFYSPMELNDSGFLGSISYINEKVKLEGKNFSEVFTENGVQFSERVKPAMDLQETVEQTEGMIAVHNLSEEKLLKTFSLGAFPMPSIAITKASIGHKGFGDISLLFRKDTIDPQFFRSNKVYSGDAWTPTYPHISYKVNDKVAKKVRDKYYELSRKFGDADTRAMYKYGENLEDTLNRDGGEEEMLKYLYEDTNMMQIYLQDTGRERIQPIEVETRTEITEAEAEMHRFFIDALGADIIAEYETPQGMSPMTHRKAYLEKYQAEIKEAYKRMLAEQFGFTEEEAVNATSNLSRQEIVQAVRGAYLYSKNNGVSVKVETDTEATSEAIRKASADGYKKWIDNLFKGAEEKTGIRNNKDTFTPSGNRRSWDALHYEETLENVIRAMKENGEKGIGALGGNIFGAATVEFGSIDEIKEAGKNLRTMSHDEWVHSKQEFQERFTQLAKTLPNSTNFMAMDSAAETMIEAVAKFKTRDGIARYLKKELAGWAKYSEQAVDDLIELVNDIRNMPVNYFEAKPLRAVGFDEVAYAVIPDNASEKIRNEISNHGIHMREYKAGDEDSRVEVVNSLDDVQFSDRDSNGNGLTPEQVQYFKDSKIRDDNGNLLVLYRSADGGRTVWNGRGAGSWAQGIYLTDDVYIARAFAANGRKVQDSDVLKVYAKAINPLVVDAQGSNYMDIPMPDDAPEWLVDSGDWEGRLNADKLPITAFEHGYDAVIIKNVREGVGGGPATDVVLRDSNQMKNVDNTSPTADDDIRYSERQTESIYDAVGELKRLQRENEKLKRDVERLRERNRLERTVTGGTVLNDSHIEAVAGHILKNADSRYNKESLAKELKDIYGYLQSEEVEWDILMSKATDTAQRILADVRERKVQNDYAKMILDTLRTTRVSLNDTQKNEAKYAYGKDWYKNYFGRVLVANDGIPLDVMWQEWAMMYPDVFDADISDADMVTAVLDAYDAVKASSEIVEAFDNAEAARDIAMEIYNQFWNVSPVRTLADKQAREVKRLKYEHRVEMRELKEKYNQRKTEAVYKAKERYKETIKNLKEKRAEEVKRIKEQSKEYNKAYREKLEKQAAIDKITKKALKLNTWLVKNSKDEHVSEILKKPIAAVLKSLNFSSERLLGMRGGDKAGEPTNKDISLSKAFEGLADMVANVNDAQIGEKDISDLYGYLDLPSDFVDFVRDTSREINDILREVGDNEFILNQMSLDQLEKINSILTTLSHTVTQTNKALAAAHGKSIASLAQDTMAYAEQLGKHSKLVGKLTNFFNFDNALPVYAFKQFGDGGKKIFEAMQDGWDKFAFNVKEIIDYTNSVYDAKEVQEWGKEVHEFDLLVNSSREKVKMTTAQIMSLYALQKREQAKGHLIGGGIRIADFTEKKGTVSQPDGATLTESDINRIVSTLTARQVEVADRLQEFMNTVTTDWGNEISMKRFGYKAFGEENYFPIKSDSNNLAQDDAKERENSLFRLLNLSFTKGTIKNANNRVVIDNMFDVFASHTSDMAKYNALALPVLDAFKWYNYKEKSRVNPRDRDDRRFATMGVKQSLEKAYGDGAKSYIVQFLRDINGANSGGITTGEQFAKKMISNYKVAAVGANLRVAILQPTSYIRASVVMNPKYLVQALSKKPQIDKAKNTTGIALWKSMGFFDTNIAKGVTEQIKHDETKLDKAREYSMKLAEWGDSITWGYLYNAAEAEISDTQPGLSGKEKDEAVAKRLRDIIYATQVVDSTMTRTQMMRNTSTFNQMLTSFMSEPMVSYNLLHDCFMQFNADRRATGSASTALKRNGKKIARATFTYFVTSLAAALAGSIPDTLRSDEEDEEFVETYFSNVGDNMLSDVLGMIPVLKSVFSVMQGYSSTRMEEQFIASTWRAMKDVTKAVEKGELDYKTVYSIAKAASQTGGLPFNNVMRDVIAIWNSTVGEVYESMKIK